MKMLKQPLSKLCFLVSIIYFSFSPILILGQNFCETELSEGDNPVSYEEKERFFSQLESRSQIKAKTYPVRVYVFRKSNSSEDLDARIIQDMFRFSNNYFSEINVSLEIIGEIIKVDYDELHELYIDSSEGLIKQKYFDPNAINVYFADLQASEESSILCGRSSFPFRLSEMYPLYMNYTSSACDINEIFVHELGHYFGLLHTHTTANGKELVARTNCHSAGDLFCDTPADPGLSSANVNEACVYTGTSTDNAGDLYRPDPSNFMSYAPEVCMNKFSKEQKDQMIFYSENNLSERYPRFDPNSPYLALNIPELEIEETESQINLRIYSNGNWIISSDVPWMKLSKENGVGSQNVLLSWETNPYKLVREGVIRLEDRNNGIIRTIEVKQKEGEGTNEVGFVIDVSGSMKEEINAVKTALKNSIDTYDPSLNTLFHIVAFTDEVFKYPPTSDLNLVKRNIDRLSAGGGDHCPEGSIEALIQLKTQISDNSTVFMVTDAAPWGGSPYREVAEEFRARNIQFHAVVSGDCEEGPIDCPSSYFNSKGEKVSSSYFINSNFQGSESIGSEHSKTLSSFPYDYKNADASANEVFSYLANQTGGIFSYLKEINCEDITSITRYTNTIFNIIQGGISQALLSTDPGKGYRGSKQTITINGSNTDFNGSTTIEISGFGISINSQKVISSNRIELSISISPFATLGFYDINARTNIGGGRTEIAKGKGVFEVLERVDDPIITSVTPPSGVQGKTLGVEIIGANIDFRTGSISVDFGPGIHVSNISTISSNQISATIKIEEDAIVGTRDVYVISNGLRAQGKDLFRVIFDGTIIPPPPVGCSLPSAWSSTDVGGPAQSGEACYKDGVYTVTASGSDIYNTSDEFHYAYQRRSGDMEIIARVMTMGGSNPWTKAGVMIREGLSGSSKHVLVDVTREKGSELLWRSSNGGSSDQIFKEGTSTPYWVRLVRTGNSFAGYVSSNGYSWDYVGSTYVSMSSTVYVGLAYTSHDNAVLASAQFDNVNIKNGGVAPPPPPVGCSLPSAWSSTDVGGPAQSGEACYKDGVYTVTASGADIYNTSDEFHYAYQRRSGDMEIIARVMTMGGSNPWTKAGVMIREGLSGSSKHVLVDVTREKGSELLWRSSNGGSSDQIFKEGTSTPYWVRLVRTGNSFAGYVSSNGYSWDYVGSTYVSMSSTVYVGLAYTSHDNAVLASAQFDNVNIKDGGVAPPPPPVGCSLPSAWSSTDVGGPAQSGEACYKDGVYTVTASGSDIYNTSDEFHYAYQRRSGDMEIIARVMTMGGSNPWTKAGVMIREGLSGSSKHVLVDVTREKGSELLWRSSNGGSSDQIFKEGTSTPYWVRLVRTGNSFAGYVSSNGYSWDYVGSTYVLMSSTVYVGLAYTSHDNAVLASAQFDNVNIKDGGVAPPPPPVGCSLPSAWSSTDVGGPAQSGEACYKDGVYTVTASGADIYNTSDEFHYAYQRRSGDMEIIARVMTMGGSNPWTKAGVMIRESLSGSSKHVLVDVTREKGSELLWRSSNGGSSDQIFKEGTSTPYWVRLVRTGNSFAGYVSSNGYSWDYVGSTYVSMSSTVYVGLAYTSHDNAVLASAQFDNVNIKNGGVAPPPPPVGCSLPSAWSSTDVGGPAQSGEACYKDGVYTVTASGADIYNTSDEFHYAYQRRSGDMEIIARVMTMGGSNPWTKAGVMIRESLSGSSKHVLVDVTREKGSELLWRSSNGGSSDQIFKEGTSTPYWVRLVRTGNSFAGYVSSNGYSWDYVGSTYVSMSSTVYVGLAYTSHDNAVLASAEFDNVSVGNSYISEPDYSIEGSSLSFELSPYWEVNVFPNPTKGEATISISGNIPNEIELRVFDLNGKLLNEPVNLHSERREIKLNKSLSSGVYIITLDDGYKLERKKIVKLK